MTFSFDWDDVRPMRTYWHTANQMCYGTGTVWGRGTSGGVNRDRDVVTPSTCGSMDGAPGSVTFCSWNKVRGDGSSVQMIQWRLNAAWRYHRSVAPIWPDPSAPMPTAELNADGIFGTKTYEMARWFQGIKRIRIDGLIGMTTWGYLTHSMYNG